MLSRADGWERVATPVHLWAVIVIGARSSWIRHDCVHRTRAGALKVWVGKWKDEATGRRLWRQHKREGRVRLSRVLVAELEER